MASVTVSVPTMFADHHVMKVRDVLFSIQGVEDVFASSAWHAVIVSYNPDKTEAAAINKALTDAGYTPDKPTPVLATAVGHQFKDPSWDAITPRVTQTNETDIKMSKIS